MRVRALTRVWPAITTWLTSSQSGPSSTGGPAVQNGPMRTPAPSRAPPSIRAVGWMIGSIPLVRHQHGADFRLGNERAVHLRFAPVPPHVPAVVELAHVVLDPVAGRDGLAELRLVDGHEEDLP